MEVSVANQAYIFLSSVVGGLVVGLLFDIFRIIRRIVKTGNVITYVEDLLFWMLVTITIFSLVFITNSGELRWFEFLGVILGVLFYNLVFSMVVLKISITVINFLKKIILFIFKVILFPFAIIYKIIRKPCGKLLHAVKSTNKKLQRRAKCGKNKMITALKNFKIMLKKI